RTRAAGRAFDGAVVGPMTDAASTRRRSVAARLEVSTPSLSRVGRVRSGPASALEGEQLDPAADVEADAGDVGSKVRAQECDRIRDILRLARTAHGGASGHPLVHLRV